MSQSKTPDWLRIKVVDYFGYGTIHRKVGCVVTDHPYEVHHLDGDHNHHHLGNVVPLATRLNRVLGGSKELDEDAMPFSRVANSEDGEHLKPDWLLQHADDCFRDWRVAAAYGCAHLACFTGVTPFFLWKRFGPQQLSALRPTLYYARQRFNREIIEYIIDEELLPLIRESSSRIDPLERILTLQEMCALLSEQGEAEFSAQLSMRLLAIPAAMSDNQRSSLLRRIAQSRGMSAAYSEAEVIEFLDKSKELVPLTLFDRANRANSLGFFALARGARPLIKRAYEEISELYFLVRDEVRLERSVPMTVSNAAGIAANYAILECHIQSSAKWEEKRDDAAKLAITLFRDAGTLLWRLREEFWDHVFDEIGKSCGTLGALEELRKLQREPLSIETISLLKEAAELLTV